MYKRYIKMRPICMKMYIEARTHSSGLKSYLFDTIRRSVTKIPTVPPYITATLRYLIIDYLIYQKNYQSIAQYASKDRISHPKKPRGHDKMKYMMRKILKCLIMSNPHSVMIMVEAKITAVPRPAGAITPVLKLKI